MKLYSYTLYIIIYLYSILPYFYKQYITLLIINIDITLNSIEYMKWLV